MSLKKNIKIGEFLCSHFNTEDGRKYATLSAYMSSYSRKVKMQQKCKKTFVQCMEKIQCLIKCVKAVCEVSKFRTRDFSLDDAPRSGRPLEVDSD